MAAEKIYVGTELKFKIEIEAPGFSMDDDDFTVTIRRRSQEQLFRKGDLVTDGEGGYYVCFDTAEFGAGLISAVIRAYVPDDDFEDGFRTEVMVVDLAMINKV